MEHFQISEETKNKILLYTAQSLPDRPGERGMKAQDTKVFFYKYIGVLIEAINSVLSEVIGGVSADITAHDSATSAHPYLLRLISDLQSKDTELGNSIGAQINTHNSNGDAHSDIRKLVAEINSLANDAYNLAMGKSKVHPCEGLELLLSEIEAGELTLHPGDIIILKGANIPDLAVFATEQESKPSDDLELTAETILEEKQSYYYNGITFVAIETGIDTSKLAKGEDVENIKLELKEKEQSLSLVESTDTELILNTHTEYSLGLIIELRVSLPDETDGLEVIINFRCGTTAPSFDAPSEVFFQGDDTLDGRLYPVTNRLYEINIKKVLGVIIAKVGAMDYEVIE